MITLNPSRKSRVQHLSEKARRNSSLGQEHRSNIAKIDNYFFYVNTLDRERNTIRVSYIREGKLVTELTTELLILYYNSKKQYVTLLEFVEFVKRSL